MANVYLDCGGNQFEMQNNLIFEWIIIKETAEEKEARLASVPKLCVNCEEEDKVEVVIDWLI